MIVGDALMLIDLGIARTWRAGGVRDTVRLGTPGYAPPEQFGYGQTTPQSDIYAAGMVMAFCFTGENPTSVLRESGFDDARISDPFRAVLVKATAIDPLQRYASAREMKEEIARGARAYEEARAVFRKGRARGGRSAQDAGNTGGGRGVQDVQDVRGAESISRFRHLRISTVVGRVWNALLILAWLFLLVGSLAASFMGSSEFLERLPIWFRLVEYFGLIVAPAALVAFLLADKRRIRAHVPALARFTWKRALVVCLGSIAGLYVVTITLHRVLFAA